MNTIECCLPSWRAVTGVSQPLDKCLLSRARAVGGASSGSLSPRGGTEPFASNCWQVHSVTWLEAWSVSVWACKTGLGICGQALVLSAVASLVIQSHSQNNFLNLSRV